MAKKKGIGKIVRKMRKAARARAKMNAKQIVGVRHRQDEERDKHRKAMAKWRRAIKLPRARGKPCPVAVPPIGVAIPTLDPSTPGDPG